VLTVGTIAILSIPYGYGSFHKRDTISLLVAIVGTLIAVFISSPFLALLVVIAVDITGVWLTVYKSWKAPHTETLVAWIAASASSTLALFAIGRFELSLVLYAVYGLLANWLITLVILLRRSKVVNEPNDF
jgi:membrane-anchored glycerophosphoryl diester phosphodiesterase (GDPDase)